MPGPEQIRDEFSPLIDGELDPETRATIEDELSGSAALLRELDQFKKVSDLYAALPPVSAPEDFEARLAERLEPDVRPFWRRPAVRAWLPALAAACVVLVAGSFWWSGSGARDSRGRMYTAQGPETARAEKALAPSGASAIQAEESDAATLFQDKAQSAVESPVGKRAAQESAPPLELRDESAFAPPAIRAGLGDAAANPVPADESINVPDVAASKLRAAPEAMPPPPLTPPVAQAPPMPSARRADMDASDAAPPPPSRPAPQSLGRGLTAGTAAMKDEAEERGASERDPIRIERDAVRARFKPDGNFTLQDGVWIEAGYRDEPTADWEEPSAKKNNAQAENAAPLTRPVVFKRDGAWYRFTPESPAP